MSAYHPLPEFLEIARALQITGRRLGDALVPRSLRNREKKKFVWAQGDWWTNWKSDAGGQSGGVSMSQTVKVCTQWSLAPGLVSKKNLWLSEVILSVFFRGSWQKRSRAVWSASLTPPLGLCHPISHSVKRGGDGFIFECPGVRPATFNWEKSDRPLRPLSCPPVPPDQSLFSSVLVWTRYALHRDFKGKNKQTKKIPPDWRFRVTSLSPSLPLQLSWIFISRNA